MSMSAKRSRITGRVFAAAAVAGMAWWSCGQLTAPFVERERKDRDAVASLQGSIAEAREAIQQVRTLEGEAEAVRLRIGRLDEEIPAGPAMVWLPELVKQHFSHFGLSVAIVRMNTTRDVPDLSRHSRGYWSVGLPIEESSFKAAGAVLAVAEFEQQNPFVKVLDFAIRPDPEHPQGRIAVMNLTALIRKETRPVPEASFRVR